MTSTDVDAGPGRGLSPVAALRDALWVGVDRARAFGESPRVTDTLAVVRRRTERPAGAVLRWLAVVSPVAWLLIVSVPILWWASNRFGWIELRVVALLWIALLVGALAFIVGAAKMVVELDLSRDRVVVGERAVGRVLLTNTASGRSHPLLIELRVGPARADFDLPALKAGEEHEELFAIPTHKRAVLEVGPVRSVRGDPLGLLRQEVTWTEAQDLFVHPRTTRLQGSAAGFIRDLEGATTKELSNSDVSFHALRGYVPGDDRRYIHWRTSARTGTLMVRQFEETRRSHLLVALSTHPADYASEDEFELAVSAAGSLAVQALLDESSLTVADSTDILATPSPKRLLDQLSGINPSPRTPALPTFARALSKEIWGASVAILVTGSGTSQLDLRRAHRHFGPDVRTFAIRAVPTEQSRVITIGQLPILTVGALDEMPLTLRRVMS